MKAGNTTEMTVSLSKLSFLMEDLILVLKAPGFISVCNCLRFLLLHRLLEVAGKSSPLCMLGVSTLT